MHLFTSESVTVGHPDKVCDQISDAILDAYLAEDQNARVAAETVATARGIILAGEITSTATVDRAAVARRVIRGIGYNADSGLDPDTVTIYDHTTSQSPEISAGVRSGEEQGAGDQGIMFGYATRETASLLPAPILIAHTITAELTAARRDGRLPWARPDGKAQATIDRATGRIHTIVVSTQHDPDLDQETIAREVTRHILTPYLADDPRILINPSGSFVQGGPGADTGLTGRKIIVDTYGGAAPHGGGAFSGKDPSKVDRSAAYAARWLAKHVVAAGIADECEVQLAYAIGVAEPVGVHVATYGTSSYTDEAIGAALRDTFDLRPGVIIRDLDLRAPRYEATARNGHFSDPRFPWEQTPRIDELRTALTTQ